MTLYRGFVVKELIYMGNEARDLWLLRCIEIKPQRDHKMHYH